MNEKMKETSGRMHKLMSLAVVACMVLTGFTILFPMADELPFIPDTTGGAYGELDDGADWSHADGHWEWGGSWGNEELVTGAGDANEVSTDPHDILLIIDYMGYSENPQGTMYYQKRIWNQLHAITGDLHENERTVDTWACYPYLSPRHSHREGRYDDVSYFNYYPSLEIMEKYRTIIIHCYGAFRGGIYYTYESPRYSTHKETFSALSDYMDGGGNVGVMNYALRYYYTYNTNYMGPDGANWVRNYLGITRGTQSSYTSGYRVRGVDGTIGDGIAATTYPQDYAYVYGYDRYPRIFNPDTVVCYQGSQGSGSTFPYPVGWQTETGDWRSALTFDFYYMRLDTSNPYPNWNYRTGIPDTTRKPMTDAWIEFIHDRTPPPCSVPGVNPVEIQSTGTKDEWIELTNTISDPVNLYNLGMTTDGSSRSPSSWFGGYEDLSGFGIPALLEDQTYFLNAEDLYIDTYYAPGSGPYDNFYLYRVTNGNEYGKYYRIGSAYTVWWDANDEVFLNEDDKDLKSLGYLEDHVYQIRLPADWYFRHQYVELDANDDHKYETNQDLSATNPGGTYLDLDWEALVDGNTTTPNTETQALADLWLTEYGRTLKSTTLEDLYVKSDLTSSRYLYLYDDNDASYITRITMTTSSAFWKVTSLPNQGIIFVNDNNPDTMFYYSHYTGGQAGGPGAFIEEIDITDPAYFDHHTNDEYFQDESRTYGSTTVDFTGSNARNQITTITLTAPILADTVFVNKNTRAITSGPAGGDIVEISLDLLEDDHSWLFSMGTSYRDYTTAGAPAKNLDHLIVVDDSISDVDGNKNELVANGAVYMWNHEVRAYAGMPIGWGTSGPAPEPAGGMSAQAYFDGSRYRWGNYWTLGAESRGEDNSVAAPAYDSVDVVINEINPAYVELYNRGGSTVNLGGWTITGEGDTYTMSGSISPGGFKTITELEIYIPFTPFTGGRMSLFDDLGVLVSSIGYQTDVSGNQYSYCARHLDGMGTDLRWNDTMGQPWANGDPDAQKNADWDHNAERTPGSENFDGVTILQIGTVKDSDWSLVENLSSYNADWADGTLGTKKIDDIYIDNFDVVFCLSGPTTGNAWILDEYATHGGRLYVEASDWSALQETDLYTTIGITATQETGSASALTGAEPVNGGMQMAYTGTFSSKFTPNSDTFRVWEEGGNILAVLYVDIDTRNPSNSYRVVASAVQYEKMSEMTRGDMPYDFTGAMVDYFLLNDDDVNHQPVIELKDPLADPEIPLYKTRPILLWQNQDIDVWDQVAGIMKYTLYISTERNDVASMDPDAQSAVFVQEPGTATMVDTLDAPVAGIYYWGIFAEDKYEKTTYEHGGVFKYDSESPSVGAVSAMNTVTGIIDDPLPIGLTRVFGPGYTNSQGETVGRPDAFVIELSDNFGLKFSNNHIVAHQLFKDEYVPPATAFSVQVLYFYGGQFEDDLPIFNLYVDDMGTNMDLESLTGTPDVTFYMIPDGPIPDGQYHIYIQAADEVRWGSYMDYTFEVDLTAPDQPVDIMIDPATYIDQFDELFLKAGETYTLSVTGPSSADDGSMNRVEFQQAVANFPGATWETIGTDYDVTDNTYSVLWTPDTDHFYLRAIAYDYVENFVISEVFTAFHVDGIGPEAPLTVQANLDLTHTPKATVSGYVFDAIIEGQTSGVAYVVLWHYDSASDTMELVTDDQGMVVQVPVVDLTFEYTVGIDAISGATGDKAYAFYAQAIDNVGNEGEMSTMATWINTGEMESIRVISPSSIKDVPMGIEVDDTDDSLDEVRSITVTFLNTEQDFMNYMFTIRANKLRTSSDATAMGLPQGTKFLYNSFNVEVPADLANYEAQVTIVFHLSARSQLGTRTAEILENIRLVTRHSGEKRFEVLDIIGGQPQVVDEAKGLYRVQARVNRFSDFAVIIARTDVTVSGIILGANPALSGEKISITVTVHNGGDFPKDAENVKVKVFAIDEDGNQEYIGELDYGTIDPDVDHYLGDPALKKGDKQARLYWATSPLVRDGEKQIFTIRAQVDPDGYVREVSETNNELTKDVELVGSGETAPSFVLTFMLMASP